MVGRDQMIEVWDLAQPFLIDPVLLHHEANSHIPSLFKYGSLGS